MTSAEPVSSQPEEPRPTLLANYLKNVGGFDELFGPDSKVRASYQTLTRELEALGLAELKRRAETCRRLVHEQGITYNVYGDPRGLERPWQLDPIPFLMGAGEWRKIEAGLIQRARLLDRILADCYGAQDLIRSGGLPPALVFGQPDFLRPCHAIKPPRDTFLHFYAADLARSPDGRWWVISDRTQIPTGAGYTLANRLVTSRILPEAFRDCQVHRLAGFFREMQGALRHLAPRRTEDPRVVLLTPGPHNETYFEQAYLARYLGFALVEGPDLTVRDDRVFLKTLSGLESVDVILRRTDDDFCDPLELRSDSMLGVPGLVGALRAGNVAVANALGSGLLQTAAYMPFLPGLCTHLFNEELLLPSVATWWGGQKSAERHITAHLDELLVKPAFPIRGPGMPPESGHSKAELEDLRRRIAFQPHLFVAQEFIELSTGPSWNGEGLVPGPVAMRAFVVATPGGYRVMPGGLTRIAPAADGRFVTMQRGGSSKDTWILSDGPVEEITLLQHAAQSVELRRVGNNLPSRMADNFFWLGRYAARADAAARLLRAALIRFSPESGGHAASLLAPLAEALEKLGHLAPGEGRPAPDERAEALEADLLAAIFDPERRGSLRSIAGQLQRLGMLVRDRTSTDLWRVVSQLDDRLASPATSLVMLAGDAVGVLNHVLLHLASFYGLVRENMTRAQGWRFIDMGLRLERAVHLGTSVDCALRSPEADNPSFLEAVLEIADSSITYRTRYNLLPHLVSVYDLVLLDDTNPRSLLFQLNQLVKHFERLPRERESALPSPAQRLLIESVTRVRLLDPRDLGRLQSGWDQSETAGTLRQVLADLPRISDAIAVSYFAHSAISRAGRQSGRSPMDLEEVRS